MTPLGGIGRRGHFLSGLCSIVRVSPAKFGIVPMFLVIVSIFRMKVVETLCYLEIGREMSHLMAVPLLSHCQKINGIVLVSVSI